MKAFTIFPKLVKVYEITYGRQIWNGVYKHVKGKRLIIGDYYIAEHSKTPGLEKGDAFIIEEKYID